MTAVQTGAGSDTASFDPSPRESPVPGRWAHWACCAGRGDCSHRCAPRWYCCSCWPLPPCQGRSCTQRGIDPVAVAVFFEDHPTLAPILDTFSLFDVFAAPWFAAIYLLLMTSLTGCVVPRGWHYAKALRAQPPPAPRSLDWLPHAARWESSEPEPLHHVVDVLRRHRFRVVVDEGTVRAEKGYLRETGNLAFHISLSCCWSRSRWDRCSVIAATPSSSRAKSREHADPLRRLHWRSVGRRRRVDAVLLHARRIHCTLRRRSRRSAGCAARLRGSGQL